jgi:hypothetical protein
VLVWEPILTFANAASGTTVKDEDKTKTNGIVREAVPLCGDGRC